MNDLLAGLFPVVVVAGVSAVVFLVASYRRRERLRVWRQAALAAGIREVRVQSDVFETSLSGSEGPLHVKLETYRRGKQNHGTRLTISGLRHPLGALSVRSEGLGTAVEKRLLGATEIELGDPQFDRQCFVQGPVAVALATLDERRRRELARLLQGSLSVDAGALTPRHARVSLDKGALQFEIREAAFSPGGGVRQLLLAGLRIARDLLPPEDLALAMAENLRVEREPGVRLRQLRALAVGFRDHPATREALLAARQSPDEELRLSAARFLGPEGRDTLAALLASDETSDGCRSRALDALGGSADSSCVEPLLRRALRGGWRETARGCLARLGSLRHRDSEPLVLEALAAGDEAVAIAAANALRTCGGIDSVAPLLETARSAAGNELRHSARQAVGEIQSRLPGAGPGQLTLSESAAGALSVIEDDPGRLSLADHGEPPQPAVLEAENRVPGVQPEPAPEAGTPPPRARETN